MASRTNHRRVSHGTEAGQPAGRRRIGALALVLMLSGSGVALLGPGAGAKTSEKELGGNHGLRIVGLLPEATSNGAGAVVSVLPKHQRLLHYSTTTGPSTGTLRLYDLGKRVPTLLKKRATWSGSDIPSGPRSIYTVAGDDVNNRYFFLEQNQTSTLAISIVDGDSLKIVRSFDLISQVPGFVAYGFTYAADDNRLYIVGDWSVYAGTSLHGLATTVGRATWVSGVVAVDLQETPKVAWYRIVTQCSQPLFTSQTGSFIARSQRAPVLYFACMRMYANGNLSGIIRMSLTSAAHPADKTDQTDANSFAIEHFPISGNFANSQGVFGSAHYDPRADRIMIQSLTRSTPGAWVFDGIRSAWVGQIGAPNYPNKLGFSSFTGHVYMSSSPDSMPEYMVVGDARSTPAAQGTVLPLKSNGFPQYIMADPTSNRIFVAVQNPAKYGFGKPNEWGFLVVEDRLPPSIQEIKIDYDDLTSNIPEGSGTVATYSGTVSGFGSRALLVGGYGGIWTQPDGLTYLDPKPQTLGGEPPGDRGLFAARVPGLDLRNVGSSAAAQAVSPDPITDNTYGTRQSQMHGQGKDVGKTVQPLGDLAGQKDLDVKFGDAMFDAGAWRWPAIACLDGGGDARPEPESTTSPGGSTSVVCNLPGQTAAASASFSSLSLEQAGVEIFVASSAFATKAWRSVIDGLVTESISTAKGVRVVVPNVGSLSIGRVTAKARTLAHGHPGTALQSWDREFEDVVLRNAEGGVYRCDECNPVEVVRRANMLFETTIRIRLPRPERMATPKGAYASIQKSESDYWNDLTVNNDNSHAVPALEMVVIHDTVEKSRLILQFAAIQASSIYGISLLPPDQRYEPPPQVIREPAPPPQIIYEEGEAPPARSSGGGTLGFRSIRSALFLIRSPREIALTALLLGIFVAACGGALRRRKLIRLLEGGS